jgi:hypothetical protein
LSSGASVTSVRQPREKSFEDVRVVECGAGVEHVTGRTLGEQPRIIDDALLQTDAIAKWQSPPPGKPVEQLRRRERARDERPVLLGVFLREGDRQGGGLQSPSP